MSLKYKHYFSGVEEVPIIVNAQTYEDALSMSEDIFGDRVSRLEKLNKVQDTAVAGA